MAKKTLFQDFVERNKIKRYRDLTGVQFDNFRVTKFIRKDRNYFIWRCKCSCGATFDRSSKTINSHPDGHCGSSKNHSKWYRRDVIVNRFLGYFRRGPKSRCWEWIGPKRPDGYGVFQAINPNSRGAHRFSYEHFVGPIPKGAFICHKCDNPGCVNPHHLYAGSAQDNMRDKHRGARHKPFALTMEDVKIIRERMARGLRYGDIRDMADEYGCDKSLLHLIKNNKIWHEVPWPDWFDGNVKKIKGGHLAIPRKRKSM